MSSLGEEPALHCRCPGMVHPLHGSNYSEQRLNAPAIDRRGTEGCHNLERTIYLPGLSSRDEEDNSLAEYVMPPQLVLLVWVGIIALPWSGLFWLAAFLGRLAA